jgi:conjugative transposon TraN protein
MKKISAITVIGILLLLIDISAFCQQSFVPKPLVIEPYALTITYSKTTNLLFPYAIHSVDRGSKDVLAQKAKGIENVLQVKAASKGFEETNLTVITADGKLHAYTITYADNPSALNIQFATSKDSAASVFFSSIAANEAQLKTVSEKIAGEKRFIRGKKDKSYGMKLRLNGLYVKEGVLYSQISLQNQSFLPYDIDQFRFFIRDQKKAKRTASQEQEIIPHLVHNKAPVVKGQSEGVWVFALPRFTLPNQKYLAIQVMEKNGGRNLELKIYNRQLVRAKPVR